MPDNSANNKRIAKNTLMLYIRMFITMVVGLYTSRIVLKTLGVSDYGIYNVVGGFVTMLAYLKTAFVGGTQRFTAFALGQEDYNKLKSVFNNSISIYILLSLLILIIAETFGLWFVNHSLTIDADRMYAANWVYQCSLLSLTITLLTVTYNATIIAHEHMQVFAYISVIEALLKLGIVYLLIISPFDKLVFYSILHLSITLLIFLYYRWYCRSKFNECIFRFGIDKTLFKEMFSYSGWHLVGNLGFTYKDQISNIIMNMFLGTTINAARGLAAQVNSTVTAFSDNLLMAVTPPITKQYAAGNIEQSQKLVYTGARLSAYLIAIITIPLIINIDYILELWLDDVPKYTSEFVIITLISSVMYVMSKTVSVAIQATGQIKAFQIGIAIIMLLEIPLAYFFLYYKYPPYFALLPAIFTNIVGFLYRIFLIHKLVDTYSFRIFLLSVFSRCIIVISICWVICLYINSFFNVGFVYFILSSILMICVSLIIIIILGISNSERKAILSYFLSKRLHK